MHRGVRHAAATEQAGVCERLDPPVQDGEGFRGGVPESWPDDRLGDLNSDREEGGVDECKAPEHEPGFDEAVARIVGLRQRLEPLLQQLEGACAEGSDQRVL